MGSAWVKSQYDGRGSECVKIGKQWKGGQDMGAKLIRDRKEELEVGVGVQIQKVEKGFAGWMDG